MAHRNITIIGANGNLGPHILSALLAQPNFTTSVLSRHSSKSTFPESAKVVPIADDLPADELVAALKGQDALIVTFAGSIIPLQIKLADACVAAGVRSFIPADFGSCDSSSQFALDLVPLYQGKKQVREYLKGLATDGKLSWTSLVCGHFLDYGLMSGLLHFDVKAGKAKIFDGGEIKASAATLATVAKATVAVLLKEEETRNRMLFVQSFCVSQNEILQTLERIQGRKYEIENVDSREYIEKTKVEMKDEATRAEATENMVGVVGLVDGNWENRKDFSNHLLGLENEDLEQVIRKTLEA